MKISTLIIVFFSLIKFAHSQEIKYKAIFINQCTKEVSNEVFWWISDMNSNHYNQVDYNENTIALPTLGKYKIHFGNEQDSKLINIEKFGISKDTFFTNRITLANYVSNPPFSEYFDCDNLANGIIEDYFYNGDLRLNGKFLNGQPIDTLRKYYRNGKIKELYIPQKNKKQHITYFENGNIKADYNFKKKYKKEYYVSGEIKKTENWNRKFNTEKIEYYLNGQKKIEENNTKQTEYFLNGNLKSQCTRKEVSKLKRIFSKYKNRWYEYQCYKFDSLGNKIAFIKFYGNNFSNWNIYPENLTEIKASQFSTIIIYENGKINKSVDFSTESQITIKENIIQELINLNDIQTD